MPLLPTLPKGTLAPRLRQHPPTTGSPLARRRLTADSPDVRAHSLFSCQAMSGLRGDGTNIILLPLLPTGDNGAWNPPHFLSWAPARAHRLCTSWTVPNIWRHPAVQLSRNRISVPAPPNSSLYFVATAVNNQSLLYPPRAAPSNQPLSCRLGSMLIFILQYVRRCTHPRSYRVGLPVQR
ncbi:hypothetical protein GQ53DRAFT_753421 [Thozetella sp. PMI_491]|nr:hypothetical protein GQ53DRAFT_753421 [Thozetella sp. PMI_491]